METARHLQIDRSFTAPPQVAALRNVSFADPTAVEALQNVRITEKVTVARLDQSKTPETAVFLPSDESASDFLERKMLSDLTQEMHQLHHDGKSQNISRQEYIPRHRQVRKEIQLLTARTGQPTRIPEQNPLAQRSRDIIEGIFLSHDLIRALRDLNYTEESGEMRGFSPGAVVELLGRRNRLSSQALKRRLRHAAEFLAELSTSARLTTSRDPKALVRTSVLRGRNLFRASRLSFILLTNYTHGGDVIDDALNPLQVIQDLADRNGSTFEDTLHDVTNTQRILHLLGGPEKD